MALLRIALFALALTGCGGRVASCDETAHSSSSSPLMGGSETSELIATAALDAVAPLDVDGELCTGTRIAHDLVLTAAHCGTGETLDRRALVSFEAGQSRARVLAVHPERDVMLLVLDEPSKDGVPAPQTLRPSARMPAGGTSVTIVGYGLTQDHTTGRRLALTTAIAGVDRRFFWVNGHGVRGACMGDSGGPALAVGSTGDVEIVGVLSRGSASCTGIDRFERLDVLRPWLVSLGVVAPEPACGDLSADER